MTEIELKWMLLGAGLLLLLAKILGELARSFRCPAVLGELMAGVILGPTLLGKLSPALMASLFPKSGAIASFYSGFNTIAVVLLLMVAGMEIRIPVLVQCRRIAMSVSLAGMVIPFVIGFFVADHWPQLVGMGNQSDPRVFSFFFATAMSISALPVIAKILMDLGLYRTPIGIVTIAAAVMDDLMGWTAFALVLAVAHQADISFKVVVQPLIAVVGFGLIMLTWVRKMIDRLLPWILSWSGRILTFSIAFTFFCAAMTEWMGIHALFGAMIAGIVIGDSQHFTEEARSVIEKFVASFFAPLFFASVGLKADFISNFNLSLFMVVFVVACLGKIVGCGLAARLSGFGYQDSWGVGIAMNARGAMEIILGILALQYGLIEQQLYVALILMALLTSVIAGPGLLAVTQGFRKDAPDQSQSLVRG